MKSIFRLIPLVLILVPVVYSSIPVVSTPFEISVNNERGISWIPGTKVALLIDNNYEVWRSLNEGQNWTNITPKPKIGSNIQFEKLYYTTDKAIFLRKGQGSNYILKGWTDPPNWTSAALSNIASIKMHPTKPNWFLAKSSIPPIQLSATTDFGITFRVIEGALSDDSKAGDNTFSWAPASSKLKDRVFWINKDKQFKQTDDYTSVSGVTLVSNVMKFEWFRNFLVVYEYGVQGEYNLKLHVSADHGQGLGIETSKKLLQPISGTFSEQSVVVDDTSGSLWICSKQAGSYQLFQSDGTGANFALAQQTVSANSVGGCAVSHIAGLEGIYVANVLSDSSNVQSLITYNNGGLWQTLPSPNQDSNGTPISCSGTCSLHIDQLSIVTHSKAPGFILANGNVGISLGGDQNSYLSSNGGATWIELAKGASKFQLANHGGIIVLISSEPTNTLRYTIDGAETVETIIISSGPVRTKNVFIDPTGTTRTLVIESTPEQGGTPVLRGVDFSPVLKEPCAASDYENWKLEDKSDSFPSCLLGRTTTYSRRKAASVCFNNKAFSPVVSQTDCDCTRKDFECDVGYDFVETTTQCALGKGGKLPDEGVPDHCPPSTFYFITKGYRKIAGDSCKNGESDTWAATKKPCPATSVPPPSGGLAAVVIVLVLASFSICTIAFIFALRNDNLREKIPVPIMSCLPTWLTGDFQGRRFDEDEFGTAIGIDDGPEEDEEEAQELELEDIDIDSKGNQL